MKELFYLGISFWQTLIVFLVMIGFFILIGSYQRKSKKENRLFSITFLFASIFSLIIVLLLLTPESSYAINDQTWTWENETYLLLNLIGNIYLGFVFASIPFFIFIVTINLLVTIEKRYFTSKFLGKTIFSLIIPIIIGMGVALLMIPLIQFLEFSKIGEGTDYGVINSIPAIIGNTFFQTGKGIANSIPIIFLIIVAIIVGFVTRSYINKKTEHKDAIINGIEIVKDIIFGYLKMITVLLPYVILTRIPLIFLNIENVKNLLIFTGIFALGLFISLIIYNILNVTLSNNRKAFVNEYPKYILTAFTKANSIAYLPETIEAAKRIGVDKEKAEITSTLALNIGPAICSGYYLTLISLIGLGTIDGGLVPLKIALVLFMVFLVNLSTSAVKGGDETARNAVLSSLNGFYGVDISFYYESIFSIEGLLEPIRHIGNSTSYILANLINQRKFFQK